MCEYGNFSEVEQRSVLQGAHVDDGMNQCTVNFCLADREEVKNELLSHPKVNLI
jgi:hypothetical protein